MTKNNSAEHPKKKNYKVTVIKNGPYLITGGLPLTKEIIRSDSEGVAVEWLKGERYPNNENYSLCRCGHSKSNPFCDGRHTKIDFDGTETANREKYIDQAETITGPDLVLTDAEDLCASARFCDRVGGVWRLTEDSDNPESKEIAIQETWDCPSGRLAVWDKKTGNSIEPRLEPSIILVEDPAEEVSGPIWVKGNVPLVSSDGTRYETRNRITLCRCGQSDNKPFCDGSHIPAGFTDGDKSLRE